jgi:hypothetical protein
MPWLDNRCRGTTQKGNRCKNKATANGYCHLHGGYSREERKHIEHPTGPGYPDEVKRFQREENRKWEKKYGGGRILLLLIIVFDILLLSLISGDSTWFAR